MSQPTTTRANRVEQHKYPKDLQTAKPESVLAISRLVPTVVRESGYKAVAGSTRMTLLPKPG